MANYANLLATIAANIYTNNNEEVTAAMVKAAVDSMVNSLGAGYQFMGVATPATNPSNTDIKQFYIASTPGTYTNFVDSGGDALEVNDGEVAVLKYETAWSKEVTGAATRAEFRPYGAMGASAVGGYFFDKNMVFSSGSLVYGPSNGYDTAWVDILPGATKIEVDGATPYAYRFFSSRTEVDSVTNLGANTTGEIISGASLALIAFRHSDNPGGYASLTVSQDGLTGMMEEFFPRGLYLAKNHILNVSGDGTSIKFQENSNFDCFVIYVQGAKNITLNGTLDSRRYRFFDSAEIFDGSEIVSHQLGHNTTGVVPEGAVVCVCSLRKTDYPGGLDGVTLDRAYGERKSVRMLLIGNSATDDAMSYVPFIMQNMGADVDFQIGIAMMSSSTLAMHWSNWDSQTEAYQFRLYDAGTAWQDFADKSLQWMFDNYHWDIVSLQQAQPQNINTYQPYLNKLINGISDYVDNPIKFIWYQTHIYSAQNNSGPNRSEATINQYYEDEMTACRDVIGETVCEYIVPVSTAIQNARSIPSIKALGDYATNPNNTSGSGYLNYYDGVHLQEGLPCQIAAYTFILAIIDLFGLDGLSINGESTRVTSGWTSGKNIPSPHGDPIGSTAANCLIAQKCAIMAIKHPLEVTDMNNIVDPT